jgi:DNA-binding response OmpR family regulator
MNSSYNLGMSKELQPHILLAEDDEGIREVTTLILEDEGNRVSSVNDGNIAIDLLRKMVFDLVLLDLNLLGSNGRIVLKETREGDRSLNKLTPIVIFTADDSTKILAEMGERIQGILKKLLIY